MAITKDILQNIFDRTRETAERIARDGSIGITDIIDAETLANNPCLQNSFHQYCLAHHAAEAFEPSDLSRSATVFAALTSRLGTPFFDMAVFELHERLHRLGCIPDETNNIPKELVAGLYDVHYTIRQNFIDVWRGHLAIDYDAYNEYKALAESLLIGNAAKTSDSTHSATGDGKPRPSCSI